MPPRLLEHDVPLGAEATAPQICRLPPHHNNTISRSAAIILRYIGL